MTTYFGDLASEEAVTDRTPSHAHVKDLPLLKLALATIEGAERDFIVEVVQFPRIIGDCICVETNADDQILYARRQNRAGYTRFVMNRQPIPTDSLTVILKRVNGWEFVLITAFLGTPGGMEPWDLRATEGSWKYWERHALVWGYEVLDERFPILYQCPWRRPVLAS